MWMSLAIVVSVLACLPILFSLGRRNERRVRHDWELLLTHKGKELYRSIHTRVSSEMELANLTYEEAFTVHALGSVDEAKHLLDVGYKVIEKFSPNMLRLLAAMSTFSRMVSAMAPVQPLRPQGFRLGQIASLAYLNQLLHNFLVTTAERYRLRAYILGRSFGVATRFLLSSTQRIARDEANADREWEQIQFIREDFQTLTEESLESLRVLLTSLAAEGRHDLIHRM